VCSFVSFGSPMNISPSNSSTPANLNALSSSSVLPRRGLERRTSLYERVVNVEPGVRPQIKAERTSKNGVSISLHASLAHALYVSLANVGTYGEQRLGCTGANCCPRLWRHTRGRLSAQTGIPAQGTQARK
jgi:hypothetical protein